MRNKKRPGAWIAVAAGCLCVAAGLWPATAIQTGEAMRPCAQDELAQGGALMANPAPLQPAGCGPSPLHGPLDELRWRESTGWPRADGLFQTGSAQPLVLHRSPTIEEGLYYIQNNQLVRLYLEQARLQNDILLTFERSFPARLWASSDLLLIGIQLPHRDHPRGRWHSLQLTSGEGAKPSLHTMDGSYFGPEQVLTMTAVEKPRLLVLTVQNNTGFSELLYEPGMDTFVPVHAEFGPSVSTDTIEKYRLRKPMQNEQLLSFPSERRFQLEDGTQAFVFEDERGILIYARRDRWPIIGRYVDHGAKTVHSMPADSGQPALLAHLAAPDGREILTFPSQGWYAYLDFQPKLLEAGWRAAHLYSFYRIGVQEIELLQYRYEGRDTPAKSDYIAYPVAEARLIDQSEGLLRFARNGADEPVTVALDDLLHVRTVGSWGSNIIEQLALHPVAEKTFHAPPETAGAPEPTNTASLGYLRPPITIEVPTGHWNASTQPRAYPDSLQQALEEECIIGCGDYFMIPTARELNGDWYVLVLDVLYRLEGESLAEIARLPVELADVVYYGKGAASYTAQDFTTFGDGWLVADTFGNRLLRLDAQFRPLDEHASPFPVAVAVESSNRIRLESLKGVSWLNTALRPVNQTDKPAEHDSSFEKIESSKVPSYTDAQTGREWSYYNGYVNIHDRGTGQLRSRFVGYSLNGAYPESLLPYRNSVVLLQDERVVVFDRDGGWQRTIAFPRVPPHGEYAWTVSGEGSWQLDERAGKLYLVQGFRVLEVGLDTGEARELFRQNESTPGPLVLLNGTLYFTLHTGDPYVLSEQRNRLIALDVHTGASRRFALETGWTTIGAAGGDNGTDSLLWLRKTDSQAHSVSAQNDAGYRLAVLSLRDLPLHLGQ